VKLSAVVKDIKTRPGLQRIMSNSGWMMGEQILRLVVGLFVGIWIARHLGPSGYGELSFAISLASLFGICATLGLNRILVRELVTSCADKTLVLQLMSTTLAMRMAAAIIFYLLCVITASLMGEGNILIIGLVAGGFIFSAFDCIELYFRSRLQSRVTVMARLFSFALATTMRIGLVVSGASVTAFAAVILMEVFAAAIVLLLAYSRHGAGLSMQQVDWGLARKLLAESWPEVIAGFSGLLFMRLDQVMLQHLAGPEAVGIFAVAARLSEVWYFIPGAIIASTFPNIVAQREINTEKYMRRIQLLMTGLIGLSYLVAICATLFAYPVIRFLYGEAFIDAAAILIVHVWCGVFMALGVSSGSWLMAEKKGILNLYRNLSGAAVNIVLNFQLIPVYGAVGAAFATLIAFVMAYLVFDHFVPSMKEICRLKWRALLIFPGLTSR
jgi:O-antigen/teichoic acid export membrane protein